MTEPVNVPTNGFQAPPDAGRPPVNQVPGFVPPALPAVPPAPGAAALAAPAQSTDALAAAVAALTEAMKKGETAPQVVATEHTNQSLNALDPASLEDPTLRSMAGAFKALGAGLDFDRIFQNAIDAGNPALLDIAYLKEKGGANADGLIELAQSIVRMVDQKSEANTQAVFKMAGGEANWAAATAAFNKGAPPAFKQAVAQMMDSGKDSAIAAAAELVVQFAKGQGYVPTNAVLLTSGAGANAGLALSKAEFQTELRKLNQQDPEFSAKREALYVARSVGKQTGK